MEADMKHLLHVALVLIAVCAAPGTALAGGSPVMPLPAMDRFMPYELVVSARFSGDGTLLWASNRVQLKAWDVATGRLVHDEGTAYARTFDSVNYQFNGSMGRNGVWHIAAASRDGRLLSVLERDPNLKTTAMLWDANARTMRHVGSYRAIAGFAPDNSRMAVVAHNGDVEIRDPLSGNLDRVLRKGKDGTAFVRGDGTWLASNDRLYRWPWDKPEKNKSNKKRSFNLVIGEYVEETGAGSIVHMNSDRTLRLRQPPSQRDEAGNWQYLLAVERADGTPVATWRTRDSIEQPVLVGDSGLVAMLVDTGSSKARVRVVNIATGAVVNEYRLIEDADTFRQQVASLRQQAEAQLAASQAAEAAALAGRIANRTADYQQFLANFTALPAAWVLDYNSLQGRDVTGYAWASRHYGPFLGGQTFNAIGKVADCGNGSVALLTLTRSQRGGADVALFQLLTLDVDGKPMATQDIGRTQKDSSGRPLVVSFAMRSDAAQVHFDVRQSAWDGERATTLTVDKQTCNLR